MWQCVCRSVRRALLDACIGSRLTVPSPAPQPCCSHEAEIVTLATGANHSTLEPQPGGWGTILVGKAGYMDKDEGVRKPSNWRIQGTVPPAASECVVVERWGQVL